MELDKDKFKEELTELLWNYNLSVSRFLKEVNKETFWVDKISNNKLKKLLDKSVPIAQEVNKMVDLWKETPAIFKVVFTGGMILTLSIMGFLVWVTIFKILSFHGVI